MFQRMIRAVKSMFGGLVSSMEDPKLILEQNIRELNDQIPQMNENIATVKANMMMLQKEVGRYEKSTSDLTRKIRSAIHANRDDLAEGYAMQLEKHKDNLVQSRDQLEFAEQAYEKARKIKEAFMKEKDRKIKEAREVMRASERSEWQARVADTMEQFEMGGIDQTHDEMVTRLSERTAKNEARMEMALDSVDTETMEIEANAEKIRAKELVRKFKRDMEGYMLSDSSGGGSGSGENRDEHTTGSAADDAGNEVRADMKASDDKEPHKTRSKNRSKSR